MDETSERHPGRYTCDNISIEGAVIHGYRATQTAPSVLFACALEWLHSLYLQEATVYPDLMTISPEEIAETLQSDPCQDCDKAWHAGSL